MNMIWSRKHKDIYVGIMARDFVYWLFNTEDFVSFHGSVFIETLKKQEVGKPAPPPGLGRTEAQTPPCQEETSSLNKAALSQ